MRGASASWLALAAIAGIVAAAATARWLWAIGLDGPVLYGEGAVAHAALLSRDGLAYSAGTFFYEPAMWPIFTAANYPPLFFRLAAMGDPFVAGRVWSIVATLFVALAVAWRARGAGALVALALALSWLAAAPVVVWGAAVKPDLVALALTVAAVATLSGSPRRAAVAGVLLALAVWAKPTAALPALALAAWCARHGGRPLAAYAGGGVIGLAGGSLALMGPAFPLSGGEAFWIHVVSWNALPWSLEQAALLVLVGVATVGFGTGAAVAARDETGPAAAYVAGALAIVVLGGREGATVNYLLDLAAAAALSLATVAPRLTGSPVIPLGLAAQVVVGLALLQPLGPLPGRGPGPGAWADPARIADLRVLPEGPALVEDSGLLLAVEREPVVDDLFLWSRLRASEVAGGMSFAEGERLIAAVEQALFAVIVSEADLSRLDEAAAYERARWHPDLVRAVHERYVLHRMTGTLWEYRPR